MKRRGSGILLHLTSLPSPFGIGDLGPWAYRFADFLAEAKQSYWQILPLNPTNPVHFSSPYHSVSAFAGNPLLISPEILVQEGWLQQSDLQSIPDFPRSKVDYRLVHSYKEMLLALAYERFQRTDPPYEYERFCVEQSSWLEDFALFMALKFKFSGQAWADWPADLRDRKTETLRAVQKELAGSNPRRPSHLRQFRQRGRVGEPGHLQVGREPQALCGCGGTAGLFQQDWAAMGEPGLPLGGHQGKRIPLVDRENRPQSETL